MSSGPNALLLSFTILPGCRRFKITQETTYPCLSSSLRAFLPESVPCIHTIVLYLSKRLDQILNPEPTNPSVVRKGTLRTSITHTHTHTHTISLALDRVLGFPGANYVRLSFTRGIRRGTNPTAGTRARSRCVTMPQAREVSGHPISVLGEIAGHYQKGGERVKRREQSSLAIIAVTPPPRARAPPNPPNPP